MSILVNGEYKYDIRPILERNCDINIIHGGRNIGKSYQIKNLVLRDAYEKSENGFGYVRRYSDDIASPVDIEEYFGKKESKKLISKVTKGKYNNVYARQKILYFGSQKEVAGEMRRSYGPVLGKAFGLSGGRKKKSLEYDIKNLVYEEFQDDDGIYLPKEPEKLLSLFSTIKRDRDDAKLFLISNTATQYNPYVTEWGLFNFTNQKIGTIETYEVGGYRIAVERCKEKSNKHSFVNKENIDIMSMSDWTIKDCPCHKLTIEKVLYTIVIEIDNFTFLCRLFKKDNILLWHVQPKNDEIKIGTRVIGNRFRYDNLYTTRLYGLTKGEDDLFKLIKQGKVVFSDRLCGTNFNMLLKNVL